MNEHKIPVEKDIEIVLIEHMIAVMSEMLENEMDIRYAECHLRLVKETLKLVKEYRDVQSAAKAYSDRKEKT